MNIRDELRTARLYMDGSMGTLLQGLGLRPGELPERWNILHRQDIINIHKSYFDAGSNIVCTNTFGANSLKYNPDELDSVISAAVENAREAARLSASKQNKYVALDIGPLGKLLKPYGDLAFEAAVEIFAQTVRIGSRCGVDLILIETMSDSYETKAAVLAAKENSTLPVFVSNAYGEDGKLMTGATPEAMVALLEGLGVDALGVNCSLGPEQLMGVVGKIVACSSTPVFAKPNAGLPIEQDGKTVYGVSPLAFAGQMRDMAKLGVCILGGCCGTTPEYIKETVTATAELPFQPIPYKNQTLVSSYTHCVEIGKQPILIGERISPTGKKRFKQALLEGDTDYILREGLAQQEKGSHILDVNVGLPGIDEAAVLENAVSELQAIIDLPLQIDTSDINAMERAMRIYNGKAMINSVSGKEKVMHAVFPLIKKYGGVVVALTLDDEGIPATAEGRIAIAEKILKTAGEYGILPKDIVFDTLCMSVSADVTSAETTLRALRHISRNMKMNTVLGVSNISFGLPQREIINANFFALALENGLSAAIINPYSVEMLKTYYAYKLLHSMDENCQEYIAFAQNLPAPGVFLNAAMGSDPRPKTAEATDDRSPLQTAIVKGLKEQAASLCEKMLEDTAPLDIINAQIIPALDIVGKGFENKTVYLPQLLMSAEAAKMAFEKVKDAIAARGESQQKKAKFVIATVKGDIHDIGKNIVKTLLENYGYQVIDLGKDVPPETVVETVIREKAPLCGLSALMTTTVPAMEETIRLLHESAPFCKVVVGGAVLNADYAARIGADKYAKDAMETVRYAESFANG
jgi:5-methyltetrahydrofolate--homocysteine methyltransferase